MLTLLLFAVAKATSPSLAEPDFTTVNVPASVARSCAEHLATELAARGVRVVTQREIAERLGPERQKALLGCSGAATACVWELGRALGTDAVLLGDLSRVEQALPARSPRPAPGHRSAGDDADRDRRRRSPTCSPRSPRPPSASRRSFSRRSPRATPPRR